MRIIIEGSKEELSELLVSMGSRLGEMASFSEGAGEPGEDKRFHTGDNAEVGSPSRGCLLENIQRLCKERKKSLAEVERECDIGTRSIYRWDENMPAVDKVKRVADFLGTTVDALLSPAATERGGGPCGQD